MAEYMWIFDAGDFTPELSGWSEDGKHRVDIMKVGGGTLGNSYAAGEVWLIEVVDLTDPMSEARTEYVTGGRPDTHWTVLLKTLRDLAGDD